MGKGCVYVLTNPCIRYTYREGGREVTISPVKIGMAKDVEKRLGSLNTSLPENFVHHISVFSNDAKALENIVHRLLASYRIDTKDGDRTEFFRCTVEEAVAVLKQTAKDMHLKEHKIDKSKLIGRSSCKIKSNSRALREVKISHKKRSMAKSECPTLRADSRPVAVSLPDRKILRCTSRGADATGYVTEDGFVVMKRSRLVLQVTTSFKTCKQEVKMRETFLKDGTIVGDRLMRDVTCPSISSAAKLVMGASANGKKEWK